MEKIRTLWQKYETKIVLFLGLILVAGIAFEAGYLKGKTLIQEPIVFENTQNCPKIEARSQERVPSQQNTTPPDSAVLGASNAVPADCMFVGSKNSTKYHLPTCSGAKRIKAENIVCFKSAEEAKSRGYEPSKDCME